MTLTPEPEDDSTAADDTSPVNDNTVVVDKPASDIGERTLTADDDTVVVDHDIAAGDDDTVAVDHDTVAVDHDTVAVDHDTVAVDHDTVVVAKEPKTSSRSRERSRTRRKAAQEALARRRGLTPPPLPGGRIAQALETPGPGSLESYEPRLLAPVTAPPVVSTTQGPVTHRDGTLASVRKHSRRYARAAMAALTVSWLAAIAAGVWIVWFLTRA